MEGVRHVVRGSDDVEIGLLSAGSGSPLLLVHGGAGQTEAWQPVWDRLAARWRVTAMDRRGRGSSGDGQGYSIDDEFGDVAAVLRHCPMRPVGPSTSSPTVMVRRARSAPEVERHRSGGWCSTNHRPERPSRRSSSTGSASWSTRAEPEGPWSASSWTRRAHP